MNSSCAPVASADVEIWHCDVAGNYSQYGSSTGRTFLRGIQRTDASGDVSFTTIYPGWYQGRATHIHLEVTINGASRKGSQNLEVRTTKDTIADGAARETFRSVLRSSKFSVRTFER